MTGENEHRTIPLLPLRDGVLFPGTVITIPVGRKSSLALGDSVVAGESLVAVGVQRDPRVTDPTLADLHGTATLAKVIKVARQGPRSMQIVVEGLSRARVEELTATRPYLVARVVDLREPAVDPGALKSHVDALQAELKDLAGKAQGPLAQLVGSLADEDDASRLADRTAGSLGVSVDKEMAVLATLDVVERVKLVLSMLVEVKTSNELRSKIDDDVRKEFQKGQREAILKEQLKAIQKELGKDDDGKDEVAKLRARFDAKKLPDDVKKVVERELGRLESGASGPEQGIIRGYVEWLLDLPWLDRAEAKNDLGAVEAKLDLDHHGLDDVKKRILEHLAVIEMAGSTKGTILCLSGPPGVGKTSLGKSVADALGRPFVRVALGGVRDEAEVRGHRRTYVGALPGRIIGALKKAGAKNAVFLLDEIDKLGRGWQGDPEAALLEVLDPEQNGTFTDHYLDLPFDLSEVLFICTANELDKLSPPLRDRLEVIELQGYTTDEKVQIAKSHLVPKKLAEHGIHDGLLSITDRALHAMVQGWTREAGVRQLAREITKLCRALALKVAKKKDEKATAMSVDVEDLVGFLGRQKFYDEVAERTAIPGVATGLAWTPVGGDILFIETSRMPGKGQLEITGQLGDVMKESARAALTYVRSHATELGADPKFLESSDVHIHVPAGGIPKDGPSAGVTMFTALTSLLTGRRVRNDTAMTGEVTLRGRVLPVGGIKSKVLAAHRAGLTRVILPAKNERDLDDVPRSVRDQLDFVFASDMTDVLAAALEPATPTVIDTSDRVVAAPV
jgi:ATP-dependent Lon protease